MCWINICVFEQSFFDAIQFGNLVICGLLGMPFQVQDVAQDLGGVGQLTLQQPSFFRGAFWVTFPVAFQCIEQELNAFLDAVQLCQGLLLFVQFFALKRGFVEPHGGVSDVQEPLFQPRQLTWSRGRVVVKRTGLVDGPPSPQDPLPGLSNLRTT